MTAKELLQVRLQYKELARECQQSETPYSSIVGVCGAIATEMCYNHHERGQRIWAFFSALEEVRKEELNDL